MAVLKWIQLSDLHLYYKNFDTSFHRFTLIDKLKDLCKGNVDLLFITGDIGYKGKYDSEGIEFIKEIISSINCPLTKVYIVPGNHDLRRSESRDIAIRNARSDFENIEEEDWEFISQFCFKKFSKVYQEITSRVYADVESDVCYIDHLEEWNVNIIHINTAVLAGGDDDTGNLYVCNSRFFEKIRKVNKDDINIAIGHHGLNFLNINDKTRLLQCFNQYGIILYLCGHSHKLGEEFYGSSATFLFQELTCGGLLQDSYNESSFVYGTIDTEKKEIVADLYQYSKLGWNKFTTLNAPYKKDIIIEKPDIIAKTDFDEWSICFSKYYDRTIKYGNIYSFLNIDRRLYADIECLSEMQNEIEITDVPLINCLYKSWKLSNRKDILVVGDGGMGKTVSLLSVWERLLERRDMFCLYVSLFEINDSETWFIDYLYENVFRKNKIFTDDFLTHIENLEEGSKPSCVLLLDGFNEVSREKQSNIVKEIRRLKRYPAFQIVITSRFDFSYVYGFDNFVKAVVQPLNSTQIKDYLTKLNINVVNRRRLSEVFKVPLMLTLYTQTARLYRKYLTAPQLNWIKEANKRSTIMYNYLQCQIAKQLDQLCTPEKTFTCSIAINFILPYIGWTMEKENLYSVDENGMITIFEEAISYYKTLCIENVPLSVVKEKRNCGVVDLQWNSDVMWELLNNELHLLTKYNNQISFIHQDFRDCLAAIHLINDFQNLNIPQSWDNDLLSDNILDCIAELYKIRFKISEVYEKIDFLRNKDLSNRYILDNIIRLIAKKQFGDLSTMNFSHLDLRKISLYNYSFVKNERKALFNYAKISENTFLSETHKNSITCITYSLDGEYYASASFDCTIRIRDRQTNLCVQVLKLGSVTNVLKFLPDSQFLVCGGSDKNLRIWNWKNNKVKILGGHGKSIQCIAVSKDGAQCITGSSDCTMRVWNLNQGKMVKKIDVGKSLNAIITYSRNEDFVLCGSTDGTIFVYNANSYECLKVIRGHKAAITNIVFLSDGCTFVSSYASGDLGIWNWPNCNLIKEIKAHSKKIYQLIYNSLRQEFVTVSSDRNTIFWDEITYEKKYTVYDENNCITDIAISPEGNYLLQATIDGIIRILDVNTKQYVYNQTSNVKLGVRYIAITKDNKYCLAAMDDFSIKMWNLESGKIVREYNGHTTKVNSIQCSPKNNEFITSSDDSIIRTWNIETGECTHKLLGHTKAVNRVVYSVDGQQCISTSLDKTMRVWNIKWEEEIRCETATKSYTGVSVSDNGEFYVSSALDNRIRAWYTKNNWRIFTKRAYSQGAFDVIVSPCNNQIASLHGDEIYVWKLNSDDVWITLDFNKEKIRSFLYTVDGKCIIGGLENGGICIWNISEHTSIELSDKHYRAVTCIANISESIYATASEDGTIKIWDLTNNICKNTLNSPVFNLNDCDFEGAYFENEEIKKYIISNGGIV